MEHILSVFRRDNRPIFLVGSVARHFILNGTWGNFGIVEFIVMGTRKEVAAMEGLSIEKYTSRGPLLAHVEIDGRPAFAYLYCVAPSPDVDTALKSALRKRGISIDAIALDEFGKLIDPFDSINDLKDARLRLFAKQPLAFEENALLLMRISRLVAELDLEMDHFLQNVICNEAGRILYAPRDGWFRELSMLLCAPHPTKGLKMLYKTRVLGFLLPEVNSMVGFSSSSQYHHKDLWEHTCQVIEQSPINLVVRWAALLHDVGKVWTRTYGKHKEVHFFQHEELGAVLVEGIASRFRMDEKFEKTLRFLVRYHQRPTTYQSNWTDSAIRRLIKESGAYLELLLPLSKADMTSKQELKRQEAKRLSDELQERIEDIIQKDAIRSYLPKGLGNIIVKEFDIQPSPRIGRIKKFLEKLILDSFIEPDQPADYYIEILKQQQNLPE